ncbi:MAG TPA: metal-dependent hydrolase [Solimonas sp.]|nr:metal-dependent hydrolase [Solimonas sp.]
MLPIRRDLHFPLAADRVRDWNPKGEHVTQFFNTLSLFFPVGERFFIHSVRQFRARVRDPQLQQAVAAFIGQEAMHGREHDDYNRKLAEAGLPVPASEAQVARLLEWVKRTLPAEFQLGATIALEHYTAILADILLREPRLIEGAPADYAALWRWHALEETEHKAVAYDVYRETVGDGPRAYAIRTVSMLIATAIFWPLVYGYHYRMMKAHGQHRDLRGWWQVLKFQWGTPGCLRRSVRPWLDYFVPGFHPWDHDNREFLADIDRIARDFDAALAA